MTELQIKYFLKVAQCMSFTQAAQELYLSQPSISRQIALLEEELGVRLFDRQNRNRLSLTSAGMVYQDSFLRIRRILQETADAAGDMGEEAAHVLRAGIGGGWDMAELVGCCIRTIQDRYPKAEFFVEAHPFHHLHTLLSSGALDVILCPQNNLRCRDGLEIWPVAEVNATIYYSVKGRESDAPLTLAQLGREPFYVLPQEETPLSTQLNLIRLMMEKAMPEVRTLPNRDSILLALESGQGFSIFDDWMYCRRLPGFRSLPLGETIPLCAAWMQDNLNPLIRLFAEQLSLRLSAPPAQP